MSDERLRGAEVTEPLLLRAGRGAQARALSTGLREGGSGALHRRRRGARRTGSPAPPCTPIPPRSPAPRCAATRGPPCAVGSPAPCCRPRRSWRAPGSSTWSRPGRVASLVLLPAAVWLAVDRYRGLGHALTARHLVTRIGGLRRRTVALQRDGVIGWTFRQSVFQRRAGVVTAEAVTAAGRGGYLVLDVAADDAVALADAVTPDLLTPFCRGTLVHRFDRSSFVRHGTVRRAEGVARVTHAGRERHRDPEQGEARAGHHAAIRSGRRRAGRPVLREHRLEDRLLAPGDRRAARRRAGPAR